MTIAATDAKICAGCGDTKPLEDFHRNPVGKQGRHARCKPCRAVYAQVLYQRSGPEERERQRERMVRSRYRIDPGFLDTLYEQQEGCCAICGRSGGHPVRGERTFKADTLTIDHNHETGAFRGLICRRCNSALGYFGDSVTKLVKATAYLLERGGQ